MGGKKKKVKEEEFVTLENGIEYVVAYSMNIDGVEYVFLLNPNNNNDYVVRKSIDGELVGLSNEDEFDRFMVEMTKKVAEETKK